MGEEGAAPHLTAGPLAAVTVPEGIDGENLGDGGGGGSEGPETGAVDGLDVDAPEKREGMDTGRARGRVKEESGAGGAIAAIIATTAASAAAASLCLSSHRLSSLVSCSTLDRAFFFRAWYMGGNNRSPPPVYTHEGPCDFGRPRRRLRGAVLHHRQQSICKRRAAHSGALRAVGSDVALLPRCASTMPLSRSPSQLLSSCIHYSRVRPELWRDRLERVFALGANAIETYVPWNWHETTQGPLPLSASPPRSSLLSAMSRQRKHMCCLLVPCACCAMCPRQA